MVRRRWCRGERLRTTYSGNGRNSSDSRGKLLVDARGVELDRIDGGALLGREGQIGRARWRLWDRRVRGILGSVRRSALWRGVFERCHVARAARRRWLVGPHGGDSLLLLLAHGSRGSRGHGTQATTTATNERTMSERESESVSDGWIFKSPRVRSVPHQSSPAGDSYSSTAAYLPT